MLFQTMSCMGCGKPFRALVSGSRKPICPACWGKGSARQRIRAYGRGRKKSSVKHPGGRNDEPRK